MVGRALRGGVLALVVAGYVLLASASAAGHGWWLIQHGATAHHETGHEAAARESHAHSELHRDDHDAADDPGGDAHDAAGHLDDHDRAGHPDDDSDDHDHAGADDHHADADDHDEIGAAAVHRAHAHGGHVHTHDGPTEPPPAVLVAGIGKHCLPSPPTLPVPPVMRGIRFSGEVLVPVDAALAVEAPPPRRAA